MSPATHLEGRARELLQEKNFFHLAVPRVDGSILSIVCWGHVDDEGRVLVNSAEGRAWPKHLRRVGEASISVANHEQQYEFVTLNARLIEDTHDGADDHIDALAKKFLGVDRYPFGDPGEVRIKFVLEPYRVRYDNS